MEEDTKQYVFDARNVLKTLAELIATTYQMALDVDMGVMKVRASMGGNIGEQLTSREHEYINTLVAQAQMRTKIETQEMIYEHLLAAYHDCQEGRQDESLLSES